MRILITFLLTFILSQSNSYSKSEDKLDFNPRYLSNYLSGLISYQNKDFKKSLGFFNSSKSLVNKHENFLKEYIFVLVSNNKFSEAINKVKLAKQAKFNDFFESKLLIILDSIKRKNFYEASNQIAKLEKFKNDGTYQFIIYNSLKDFNELFINKKFINNKNYGKISEINQAFQNCYLNDHKTDLYFKKLINSSDGNYSRYKFFYLHYLIKNNNLNAAKSVADTINILNESLLLLQAKEWINSNKLNKYSEYFSCQNETDILAEFFFLISNLYSTEGDFLLSEFYLKISNYLNTKFYFNIALEVDNYFTNQQFKKSEKSLNSIPNKDEIYIWYKIRKKAQIISKLQNKKKSQNFIESKFKHIKDPNIKTLYEMGNIYKNYGIYDRSIYYYSLVISKLKKGSENLADVLYRRGGSYERMQNYEKSDKDFLNALEIKPDEPYLLNYLAYSWLERNIKINEALDMLKIAYDQESEDPYIIDSIGWAYFLIGDYKSAEEYILKAVILMPDDPIVNDHYGDILWKLDRKIQARYIWNYVLKLDDVNDEMRKKISSKILNGLIKV